MIVSYRDKRTRDFAAGKRVRAFSGIERAARLMIDRLEASSSLRDLVALPGLNLQKLYELRLAKKKIGEGIRALPTLKNREAVQT